MTSAQKGYSSIAVGFIQTELIQLPPVSAGYSEKVHSKPGGASPESYFTGRAGSDYWRVWAAISKGLKSQKGRGLPLPSAEADGKVTLAPLEAKVEITSCPKGIFFNAVGFILSGVCGRIDFCPKRIFFNCRRLHPIRSLW